MIALFQDTQVVIAILFVLVIILAILVIRLELKIKRLLRGKNGASLENAIRAISTEIEEVQKERSSLHEYLQTLEQRVRKSVKGVHTVRFNPFKGTGAGGNQSFATAFVDEGGDGVVISSLYSREHVSIYAKPLAQYSSEFELSAEEKKAVEGAKDQK